MDAALFMAPAGYAVRASAIAPARDCARLALGARGIPGAARSEERRQGAALQCRAAGASAGSTSSTVAASSQMAPEPKIPQGAASIVYLENNAWILNVDGVRILVDPILPGPLDFGIPWLYIAYKKKLKDITPKDVVDHVDYLLITQSLDDHCHLNTLRPLAQLRPFLPVIATPNAKSLLDPLFQNVTYLEPGETTTATSPQAKDHSVSVTATAGPVLGPPWQRPENGYIIRSSTPGGVSVYLEPHCFFDEAALQKEEKVDIVVTPVLKQELPAYTLVNGLEEAIRLARALRSRVLVPMANGDLDASGPLHAAVSTVGSVPEFKALAHSEFPELVVEVPTPGQPIPVLPA